ncbi:M16 family metallopeptidase [Wenxinia marina]|uniref:Putative Zn-dependent peptidase n=1 Tax=Wenxinia marina DSM 24838 TaxID=1123501 RepID=A0A0D0QIJ1_9RHOB|nr:pitrilysin family protein [Wenxinia marina]KIQ70888.1 putative Zn-dependent peptidase [Wenxinia marina DSM 24838]GGL56506.1 peptidase M16 [Wenxinia marina]
MLIRTTAAALVLAAPALAEEVTTYTLDNGMDVVVIEDHRAPVVVHMVWYRAGSADEPPGVSGVAHYLEHLMFKATDDLEAGEFSATVAINGGNDNAFTSYDYTAYYQRVAADRLPLMMEMEADRMTGLLLSESDTDTERNVILEERNQRVENNAGALAQEQIAAAQYLNHRYGSPVIGWMHEMEALTQGDAQAWYDLYYSPNNAILVVAGDVEPDEVLALAEQHYGPIPAEPDLPERFRPEEPPQRAERRVIFDDPRIAQPYVRRTYLAPERDEGEQETAAALTYLAEILGGSSFTSVFAEDLVFEDPVALFAGAYYDGTSLDDTTFSVSIAPLPDVTLPQAEAALDRVLAEFLEEGVDEEQMERIRTQIRASTIYAQDNVEGLARRYGSALTSGLTVEDVQAWPDVLDAVTAEDVMAAARMVLDRDSAVTAYVLPDRAVLTAEPPMVPTDEAEAEQAAETGSADEAAAPPPETAGEAGIVTDAEEETE